MHINCSNLKIQKNIRGGGSTALYAIYTIDTSDMISTFDMVYTDDSVFTVYTVYDAVSDLMHN